MRWWGRREWRHLHQRRGGSSGGIRGRGHHCAYGIASPEDLRLAQAANHFTWTKETSKLKSSAADALTESTPPLPARHFSQADPVIHGVFKQVVPAP